MFQNQAVLDLNCLLNNVCVSLHGNPFQCFCLENPRDGEPGGLPSMGSHRVGYD